MSKNIQESLDSCLFFTVKKLDRALNKLAEESFQKVGMTPTYAFILLILAEEDGRLQKDIAQILYIAPSTLTRLVEKLVYKGYVTTLTEGRTRKVYLTVNGRELLPDIREAWNNLHARYKAILGDDYADDLASIININSEKLR
ncbi:MarR family winged helix-turn-helix transcriptional regulator [Streptococcus gallolyticus]|jgi:DNA-binding MarR family transcriptional regulator|uniref:MarR family winged helix-turn-helix transcriptional regulator n=1 Tax=Streptococcus gallolyticus TaxID=315405 RepID=UPI002097E8BB|nr:MarR family winged helix-turn-helix transcriptional regulator [Streptococcus gallolyticus]MCO7177485.1 MarR family winged helix-turn-helix transcriptional regulator [Streptococcus gallolyticus]MCY7165178.1 MarR family winged helix-turn-helix transcriptional regulator [Streptococcus gallolyticus subsp. gallolyticus]MCY7182276.1 MarR family winged helix-turn-helix transcriptional regulator [Streptococcus gallolyticus subsp. gallolyticus]